MAVDALREHEDALSGSAKTMEDTKKLLEETAAGASRLLEINRRLREELDALAAGEHGKANERRSVDKRPHEKPEYNRKEPCPDPTGDRPHSESFLCQVH